MELTALRSLIELLRESGVTSYRDGALELQLGAAPVKGGEDFNTDGVGDDPRKVLAGMDDVPEQYRRAFEVVRNA